MFHDPHGGTAHIGAFCVHPHVTVLSQHQVCAKCAISSTAIHGRYAIHGRSAPPSFPVVTWSLHHRSLGSAEFSSGNHDYLLMHSCVCLMTWLLCRVLCSRCVSTRRARRSLPTTPLASPSTVRGDAALSRASLMSE